MEIKCSTSKIHKGKVMESKIKAIIKNIGDDPEREGLRETPARVIKSWKELYAGYDQNPSDILKTTFEEGACREMVVLKDIEFYSTCEHHIIPFFGKISIGYIPDKKVVGISKLARLVEVFSRRLQIQEKLTSQIADSIMDHLEAKGCMVIAEAKHLCMIARGVKKQNSQMITSAIRGIFEKQEVRAEFLGLIK
jgi:GTP cyclohydrolase I